MIAKICSRLLEQMEFSSAIFFQGFNQGTVISVAADKGCFLFFSFLRLSFKKKSEEMRLHVSCESTYETAHEIWFSHRWAGNAQASLRKWADSPEHFLLLTYTKFGLGHRLGPNVRPLAPLNTSAWTFEESFWALAISPKICVLAHIDDSHEISFVLKKTQTFLPFIYWG